MYSSLRWLTAVLLLWPTLATPDARDEGANGAYEAAQETLPLSPESRPSFSARTVRMISSVTWEGRLYDVKTGVDVLLGVVRNGAASCDAREKALDILGSLHVQLRGEPCLAELVGIYDGLETTMEKCGVLLCLHKARDPRGLPLFATVLASEADATLRLLAAGGLAQWNIRDGVRELTRLSGSRETLPDGVRTIGEEASKLLYSLARRKDWGLRPQKMMERITSREDLSQAEKRQNLAATYSNWFSREEKRFPDWKLGDPLPAPHEPQSETP